MSTTGIEAKVCQDIAERQKMGISKYGTSVAENHLPLSKWIQHAYEESIDLPTYLKRAKEEAEKLEAQIKTLQTWGEELYSELDAKVPPKNCSCHISPPCNDCVEWGNTRITLESWRDATKTQDQKKCVALVQHGYGHTNVYRAKKEADGSVKVFVLGEWRNIPEGSRLISFTP